MSAGLVNAYLLVTFEISAAPQGSGVQASNIFLTQVIEGLEQYDAFLQETLNVLPEENIRCVHARTLGRRRDFESHKQISSYPTRRQSEPR